MRAIAVLAAAWMAAAGTPSEWIGNQPDVLIVVWDDVAYDDIKEVHTPQWDALSAIGVEFTRAYAHPWCAPMRDSLLRGAWSGAYRGTMCGEPPFANPVVPYEWPERSIASAFLLNGYATSIIGKWHAGLAYPELDPVIAPEPFGFSRWLQGTSTNGGCFSGMVASDGALVPKGPLDDTERQTAAAIRAYDDAHARGEPAFIVVAYTDAHSPWNASAMDPFNGGVYPFSSDRKRYESEIRGLDAALGVLVAAMPGALIIVVGDNGTPKEVAPLPKRAKLTTFERGVHVPMLALGPGIVPGQCDSLVSTVDIYPTLMDGLGWCGPSDLDGASFVGALLGESLTRGWVYVENPNPVPDRAVIESRWKLRVNRLGTELLYDLDNDPFELSPLPPIGADYDRLRAIMDGIS